MVGPNFLRTQDARIDGSSICYVRSWFWPVSLWSGPPLFLSKNAQQVQKVTLFFFIWRGEEIGLWFWYIWMVWWLNFFLNFFIFLNFSHLQGETMGQSWTTSANFGYVPCLQTNWIFHRFLKGCFSLINTTSGEIFSKIGQYLGELGSKNPTKKGYFIDDESVQKTFKIYNLTTTKYTLMKHNATICIFMTPCIWQKKSMKIIGRQRV